MKLPLSWLKEYLSTRLTPEQIAETLTVIGLEVEGIEAHGDDFVFEISLTPNLAHCASVRGVARELAAVTQESLCSLSKSGIVEKSDRPIEKQVTITVEHPKACPRYACRLIEGVQVTASPDWLKKRVELCGIRSVNNVVDLTNLVLMEWGHPLHAFDFDTLADSRLIIRSAKKGEKLTTLDGKEHFPTEEMLMICDSKGPVAVAGVMGTAHTEVSEKTTTILLESAYFEPTQVRRTSKQLEVQTEASYRFERGTDPNGVIEALERATTWICEVAGGTALKGCIDIQNTLFAPSTVSCRPKRVNQILGTQLSRGEMETIFQRLGLNMISTHEDKITVEVPTYRHDLHEEIDLVEEVARLYGYKNIHKRARALYRTGNLTHSPAYLLEKKVRKELIGQGLQELLTCDLISPEQAALVAPDCMPSRSLIPILNPSSHAQSVLRPSLLPGLLATVKTNLDHSIHSLSGFEIGRLHFKMKERYYEPAVASIVLTGEQGEPHWENKTNGVDFFDLKGIVENLLASFHCETVTFQPSSYANFHPGRQASIRAGEIEIGIMGEVHPETLKRADLTQPVYFAELNLEDLKRAERKNTEMIPLPHYPASSRDWTVTLDERRPIGHLLDQIKIIPSKLLESVLLLDVYRGEALGSDRKNATLRFTYRDRNKTLSLDAVEKEHNRIIQQLKESEDLS
ncbi:MAG: Phenylalanine--tRNA ligase beta subunit [Chlamydiales bacterium]|nr:Phenylalanine--tRNA ligase beta subunit [Chlamydiales bacterium]